MSEIDGQEPGATGFRQGAFGLIPTKVGVSFHVTPTSARPWFATIVHRASHRGRAPRSAGSTPWIAACLILCAMALFGVLLPVKAAQAQTALILPSGDLGECADLRITSLETGAGTQSRQVDLAPEILFSFIPEAARHLEATGEYDPWTFRWMRQPDLVSMKVREPVHLDLVTVGEDTEIAVLRVSNTSATCGAANCFTPSFVAADCSGTDAMACLTAGLESGRTRIMTGSELLIAQQAGAAYVQAARCGCSGMSCYRTIELLRYDTRQERFHQDGEQRWYLSAPFLD